MQCISWDFMIGFMDMSVTVFVMHTISTDLSTHRTDILAPSIQAHTDSLVLDSHLFGDQTQRHSVPVLYRLFRLNLSPYFLLNRIYLKNESIGQSEINKLYPFIDMKGITGNFLIQHILF